MIIAFSPEQAFEVAQAFDANWWANEALYPEHMRKEDADKKSAPDANAADTKPSATETSPETPKKACRGPNMRCRRPNMNCRGPNKATFTHCRRYNQAARCRRQAANQNKPPSMRTIEQKTPIHMHEETPDVAKMSLDVAGFAPDQISIQVDNYVVSIKGQRTNKLGDVFVLDRRFRLDKNTASVDGVAATFADGVLELTVPKKSVAGPRRIPIAVAVDASYSDPEPETFKNEDEDSPDDEEEDIPPPAQEEEIVFTADSSEEEVPQSTEESNPEEEQEVEMTAVETVHEDKTTTIEEDHDIETHATESIAIKSKEDETWEEVSEE